MGKSNLKKIEMMEKQLQLLKKEADNEVKKVKKQTKTQKEKKTKKPTYKSKLVRELEKQIEREQEASEGELELEIEVKKEKKKKTKKVKKEKKEKVQEDLISEDEEEVAEDEEEENENLDENELKKLKIKKRKEKEKENLIQICEINENDVQIDEKKSIFKEHETTKMLLKILKMGEEEEGKMKVSKNLKALYNTVMNQHALKILETANRVRGKSNSLTADHITTAIDILDQRKINPIEDSENYSSKIIKDLAV